MRYVEFTSLCLVFFRFLHNFSYFSLLHIVDQPDQPSKFYLTSVPSDWIPPSCVRLPPSSSLTSCLPLLSPLGKSSVNQHSSRVKVESVARGGEVSHVVCPLQSLL